jgi:hypothetical protein
MSRLPNCRSSSPRLHAFKGDLVSQAQLAKGACEILDLERRHQRVLQPGALGGTAVPCDFEPRGSKVIYVADDHW